MIAGFDPFREHTDDEVAKFSETAKKVFGGAKLVGDIATMNQALIAGEIDFHMTGGTYSASPARADGYLNIRGITPKKGPMPGGKGGVSWIEVTSVVNNPQISPLAVDKSRSKISVTGRPASGGPVRRSWARLFPPASWSIFLVSDLSKRSRRTDSALC